MKRSLISRLVFGLAFAGLVLGSCGASKDDNGTEFPPSPDKPAETGEYGLDPQAVKDFFASAVKGVDASWTKEGALASDQIAGASDYVWDLWKTALEMNIPEKLPALSSHQSLKDWGDIYKSDAMWSLPEGGMSIFYGSKGEKPASGYPLFLFLHGSGSDAGGNGGQAFPGLSISRKAALSISCRRARRVEPAAAGISLRARPSGSRC